MLLATQEALKHFKPTGARIINIGSVASSFTPPTSVVYSASKAAVDAITPHIGEGARSAQDSR